MILIKKDYQKIILMFIKIDRLMTYFYLQFELEKRKYKTFML
jgi:hypothetical protein